MYIIANISRLDYDRVLRFGVLEGKQIVHISAKSQNGKISRVSMGVT